LHHLSFVGFARAAIEYSTHERRTMLITIRPELPDDAAAIHAVVRAAFDAAPRSSGTEPFIVDALREAGALTISLVADEGGHIVGHVAVSPVTIDGAAGWLGLGPISVSPERQRQGIGSSLMRAALDALRAQGALGCVLLGEPDYYGRFGFEAAAPLVLPGVPPEYFLAIVFSGAKPAGVVRYHDGFEATGGD
jgi:putative acetyltransferase